MKTKIEIIEETYEYYKIHPQAFNKIGGGCGQLWFVQKWMEENPELSRPSIGYNLPIVHCPT
jgi:23S rRNA (adenine2503-C2)-methyltransferase